MQEKHLTRYSISFMIKTLNQMGIERLYLNITKTTYDKPSANILNV